MEARTERWARRLAEDWPAEESVTRGGWRLAFSEGVTRRANSATLLGSREEARQKDGGDGGGEAVGLEEVEAFYAERGLPACVHVWADQTDLDASLARRGYTAEGATLVMARDLSERPQRSGQGEGGAEAAEVAEVAVLPRPDDAWNALWPDAEVAASKVPAILRIMGRVPVMGYAIESSGAARGCATLAGEWTGVYGMATREAERGKGLAGAVLDAPLGLRQGCPARLPPRGGGQRPGAAHLHASRFRGGLRLPLQSPPPGLTGVGADRRPPA
ncbi:hypothetical protein ACFPZ0_09915 [Streptomonospora nanhaiensis]|nr:hypothetical protein [Streptomonospora nanhaiensis]